MTAQVERAADTTGGAVYNLAETVFTEKDGIYSWTAGLTLDGETVAKVSWNGPKKIATVSPLAKTTGAADEVKRFEATAQRLLPGRDSVTDLIQVLVFTSEKAITPFNRVALTKGIPGSEPIAFDPTLITAA